LDRPWATLADIPACVRAVEEVDESGEVGDNGINGTVPNRMDQKEVDHRTQVEDVKDSQHAPIFGTEEIRRSCNRQKPFEEPDRS
jgi:hypothetical protein